MSPLHTLWNATLQQLLETGSAVVELDETLQSASGGQGRFALQARRLTLPEGIGEARLVFIQGSSSEILNALIFPTYPSTTPLFAAELVVLQHAPRLLFIDLALPDVAVEHQERVNQSICSIQQEYRDFASSDPAPDWAVKYASQGYLFCRPQPAEALPRLMEAYQRYLQAWLQLACRYPPPATMPVKLPQTDDFKQLQTTQSPGVTYLNKLFGIEWTHRFLHEFLHR